MGEGDVPRGLTHGDLGRADEGDGGDEGRGRGQAVYIRWVGVVTKKAGCVMTWLCGIERAVGTAAG